jgi:hypothetical protein
MLATATAGPILTQFTCVRNSVSCFGRSGSRQDSPAASTSPTRQAKWASSQTRPNLSSLG